MNHKQRRVNKKLTEIKEKYTHKGKIYGIPCYYNENNKEVLGINWFYDKLIDIMIFIDVCIPHHDGFKVTHLEEL